MHFFVRTKSWWICSKKQDRKGSGIINPIIGDRIKVMAAIKRMETCNGNADCVPRTDARCDVEVVQQVPERPVVPAAKYFLEFDVEFSNLHQKLSFYKILLFDLMYTHVEYGKSQVIGKTLPVSDNAFEQTCSHAVMYKYQYFLVVLPTSCFVNIHFANLWNPVV